MAHLLFIRHAQAEGNAKGILMGSSRTYDFPLSAAGVAAARQKGAELKASSFQPTRIYCSELTRTRQTAEIIRSELDLKCELVVLAALNERSFGRYEGRPYADVLAALEREGTNPATVEPVDAFVARVLQGIERITQHVTNEALIVTHSNPLAVLRCSLYHPEELQRFWNFEDDDYLQGLSVDTSHEV